MIARCHAQIFVGMVTYSYRHISLLSAYYLPLIVTVELLYITDTIGTKDFVLYSRVPFAQGVILDHTPLTIMDSFAGARLRTMKLSCVDKKFIDI